MHHPSVSWHIIPLKFSRWNIIRFGQKEPINVQFFRILSTVMKVHPIPHAIFETAMSGFIKILNPCSMPWKVIPLYLFLPKPQILWTKIAHRREIFRPFRVWLKIHQIPHVKFESETTIQFFFKLCITFQCHER